MGVVAQVNNRLTCIGKNPTYNCYQIDPGLHLGDSVVSQSNKI